MSDYSFERAQDFIWKYARLLDRRLFAHLFLGAPREGVLLALKGYQNADGGFGQALEPDKRVQESQPVDVQFAFGLLDLTGALEDPATREVALHELVLPACDFLESITTAEGGVPFALPSVRNYPRAPWWQADDHTPASLNPTADLVGLLMKFGAQAGLRSGLPHPWVERAAAYCCQAIAAAETEQYHDLMPMISFLEHAPDRERAERELARIKERLCKPGVVEYDPQAGGYVKMPLDWAPLPQGFCYSLFNQATLDQHLAALAARQRPDGGWPITWDPVSPAVEYEWRGWMTIQALVTLRAYEGISKS